jgi:hypothetical protein
MLFDGADRNEQLLGDLPIGMPFGGQFGNPQFRLAQFGDPRLTEQIRGRRKLHQRKLA